MKKSSVLIIVAALILSSCGALTQLASSDDGQRFQDGIYSNRRLTAAIPKGADAERHQGDIHQYRGDTPRYVIEENGRAACGNLLEHREVESRLCEAEKSLFE